MCNEEPRIDDMAVYSVMETCAILKISKGTLRDRRLKGFITPMNMFEPKKFKYSGEAIKRLWRIENYLENYTLI